MTKPKAARKLSEKEIDREEGIRKFGSSRRLIQLSHGIPGGGFAFRGEMCCVGKGRIPTGEKRR